MRRFVLFPVLCLSVCAGSVQASTVYGLHLRWPQVFLSFDTSDPDTLTIINPFLPSTSVYAMDFDPLGTTLYGIDNPSRSLGTIDTSTGIWAPLVNITGIESGSIQGMKIDPTTGIFYVSSTDLHSSTLYSLDPVTGAATTLGTQSTAPAIIALAISASGQVYATDIVTDSLYSIDKTNGAATLIGSLGVDINSSQGMDFDYSSGILYAALYEAPFDGGPSHFATLDPSTGAATILASLGHQLEIAITSPASPAVPAPGAILLSTMGASLVGWLKRRCIV